MNTYRSMNVELNINNIIVIHHLTKSSRTILICITCFIFVTFGYHKIKCVRKIHACKNIDFFIVTKLYNNNNSKFSTNYQFDNTY